MFPTDDFLERPVFRLDSWRGGAMFAAGDVLATRFRVVRVLGSGGMGDVYEAIDTELKTAVAVKFVRGDGGGSAERLKEEILRARAVAHPHVCRVFDLFSHVLPDGQSVRFLTMELIEGETLASLLATRGPLTVEQVVPIARQVACALDEAHRLGIVHSDLKPPNIMIAGSGPRARAVVMDFGIATIAGDESSAGRQPVGTLLYMAPEQRSGAAHGPAADVYAFGVVLREMLTGTPAPAGALPRRWRKAIDACTRDEPSERPASATHALRMATGWSRRQLLASGVVLAGILATATTLYPAFSRYVTGKGDPLNVPDVIVADVANATAETELDAVTELLRRQLEQSPFLNVMGREQLADTLRQMVKAADAPLTRTIAREAAWRRQGGLVVSGRLRRAADAYVLTMQVDPRPSRPDAAAAAWTRSFEARDRDELRGAIRLAANWVREVAGEPARDISERDRPVEEVTTRSWQALDLYLKGQALLANQRQDDGLALLSEAVRVDPDFALAWMRIGDVLTSRRQYREAREHWQRALAVYERMQVTPREGYRIRGLYASDTGDYAEAEHIFRTYRLAFPNDPAPYFYSARPLMMLGRLDDAMQMLETAERRDPSQYYVPAQRGMLAVRAGRPDEALRHIAKLREMGRSDWANYVDATAAFLRNDHGRALRRFEELERAPDAGLRSRAPALQAALLAETGRVGDAIARLRKGINIDGGRGATAPQADKLLALGELLLAQGRRAEARDAALLAIQLDDAATRLVRAGVLLARAGYGAEAERLLRLVDAAEITRAVDIGRRRLRGEILLARGAVPAAIEQLRAAAAMEPPGVFAAYYARAAARAGEYGVALALYERMASSPGYYWRYPDNDTPGAWSDAVSQYVALARAHAPKTDVTRFENLLVQLKGDK